ncbi:hypothetical protein E3N88_29739 [Mikania micrantha]|uniref:RNase H type-1 domain-containing protein n=1 Tax=Mikania micrantha TaxID=192012 RepID=A0A5N6MKB2_9ASTR|nr:hypothetical protein E3N88_29739 [Mikania micrantha]
MVTAPWILNAAQVVVTRLAKWAIELGDFEISYLPRTACKGQVLADFLTEAPTDDTTTGNITISTPAAKVWHLHTDGSSTNERNGAGFILTTPEGVELAYAIRLDFPNTNNEAEYEALLAGLRMASTLGVQQLEVHVDSLLVASQMNGLYEAKEDKHEQKADALSKLASAAINNAHTQVRVEVLTEPSVVRAVMEIQGVDAPECWMTPIKAFLQHGTLPEGREEVDSTREIMNVGENRAQNGVTDCPESRNEENFQSMELPNSSRYATERLRTLRVKTPSD